MKTNTYIAFAIGLMVNAVIFGVGAVAILSVPAIAEYWKFLIPIWVVVTFAVTPIFSRIIAPSLRLRNRNSNRNADQRH